MSVATGSVAPENVAPETLVLVGLPAAGKTTFLAAVFHHLKASPGHLRLRRLPDERDHIISLESRWLALNPLLRSAQGDPRSVSLPLSRDDGTEFEIAIPDASGEEFHDAWESGEFSPVVRRALDAASRLLLLVRADDIQRADTD